jgi:hypothetical protein
MKRTLMNWVTLFCCIGATASVVEITKDDTVIVDSGGCVNYDRPSASELGLEGR